MTDYPHVPAAFINAIAEEGTIAEAIEWLQKQWNENCALREQLKAMSVPAPGAQHGCVFCAMGLTPDDDGNHYDRVMKKDVQCVEKRDKLRDALQQVHDFMLEDVKSGDSGLWTEAYSEIFDVVVDGLSTEPTPRAPDIESLCHDYAARWFGEDWNLYDEDEKVGLRIEAHRWLKCWSAAEAAPRAVNSCPCGAGEEPCPGPDGKPLCSGARSSVGSEQRTSNPQGAGSNPAERTNCPKCGRETCGCTFSAHSLWDQIAEIYDGLDAEDCAMVDREWAKQRGYILPTDGTSTVTSTERETL